MHTSKAFRRQSHVKTWRLIGFLLTFSACKGGIGAKSDSAPASGGEVGCAQLTDSASFALTSTNNGAVSFKLDANTDPCSANGYVVGEQNSTKIERQPDSTILISDVPEGDHDIIITGNALGNSKPTAPANVGGANLQEAQATAGLLGIRINGVTFEAGLTNSRSIKLGKVGSISGQATLSGQTDHTGILVYIPGTSYSARTDANGQYKIDSVPPGVHNLRFEFTGYGHAVLEQIEVLPEQSFGAPSAVLFTGSGEGEILFLSDDGLVMTEKLPVASSRTVKFSLSVKGAPRLMKVSEDGNFANVAWQPFRSFGTYTFKLDDETPGGRTTRRLSIKTNDNGTEAEFEKTIVIDMFPEIRGKDVLSVTNKDANGNRSLNAFVSLTVPANATEMRISTDSQFAGSIWQAASAQMTLKIPEPGDFTIYAQFRDVNLIQSDIYSKPVNFDLFPLAEFGTSFTAITKKYPTAPTYNFAITKSPQSGSNTLILMNHASSPNDQTALAYASSITWTKGTQLTACGKDTLQIRLKTTINGLDYVSPVLASQEIEYTCNTSFSLPADSTQYGVSASGGDYFMVWGGQMAANTSNVAQYGYVLKLSTGSWEPVRTANAPLPRPFQHIFWTGTGFLVFGGGSQNSRGYDGAIYYPSSGTWNKFSAPTISAYTYNRCNELDEQIGTPDVVFTGSHLIVWGDHERSVDSTDCPTIGYMLNISGANETTDPVWTAMKADRNPVGGDPRVAGLVDPNAPECRMNSSETRNVGITIGSKYFVWGGKECYSDDDDPAIAASGAIFDPATNSWTAISTTNQPSYRYDQMMVWTGSKVFVWGGRNGDGNDYTYGYDSGGVYDPQTDTWTAIPAAGFDLHFKGTYDHEEYSKFYAGHYNNRIAIWTGYQGDLRVWQGMIYDVNTNNWQSMPLTGAPRFVGVVREFESNSDFRYFDGAHFKGSRMYVWTRAKDSNELSLDVNLFSYFDLATLTWTAMPRDRGNTSVNTFYTNYPSVHDAGDSLIFWGGQNPKGTTNAQKWLYQGNRVYLP